MTEEEWLACDDPLALLRLVGDRLTDRKYRLFICGCCRQLWPHLYAEESKQAIEFAERFADGLATAEELRGARQLAWQKFLSTTARHRLLSTNTLTREDHALHAIALATEEFTPRLFRTMNVLRAADDDESAEAAILRDLIGNPFRVSALPPNWSR